MNDNLNPNENRPENDNGNPNTSNGGTVWNVPPQQDGQGYRPPYYADESRREASPPPPQPPEQPQQQYSTAAGWQKPEPHPGKHDSYQWDFAEYQQAQALRPKRKNKGLAVFAIIMASVLVVSLLSFAGVGVVSLINDKNRQNTATQITPVDQLPGSIELQNKPIDPEAPKAVAGGVLSTVEIVEKLEPSIVAITTYVNIQNYQAEGMGSGIIIREDGYIVTNAHVVKDARGITITMSDGITKYEGRVIGADEQTDLAVVKIDATGLTPAVFGNSSETKVGEKVLAIGNPQSLDFAGSVTQGIVSGLNRSLTAGSSDGSAPTAYASLIQTDAAINPGNSGGALVNEYGQVIGINSAKVITTGAEGMGFAIPSNEVKPIVDDLIAHGRVTGRVMLGVTVNPIDKVAARLYNIPMGLMVQTTDPNSDISKKGVVPGDIITAINGKDIEGMLTVSAELKGKKPGDTVNLEVYRPGATQSQKGRFFDIAVKLMDTADALPADEQPSNNANNLPETAPPSDNRQPNEQNIEDFFNHFFG